MRPTTHRAGGPPLSSKCTHLSVSHTPDSLTDTSRVTFDYTSGHVTQSTDLKSRTTPDSPRLGRSFLGRCLGSLCLCLGTLWRRVLNSVWEGA